jgi:hypothetical protein
MKRTLIMFLFAFYSLLLYAPNDKYLYLATGTPIIDTRSNYDALIDAIGKFESGNNDNAVNVHEEAYGRLQIRQCRVEHYNQLTGKNYTLTDMFDFSKAREVFLYFAKGKTLEQAAKNWNGSGPLTITYWEAVKSLISL